ncbi:PREDICTED: uncharacterized protein C16orf59 homolog [Charadrius vociferus]|uniref:uncharacterized protein C16orf59 homolog n=1 Tax=Charadrius vociferus TaxID=50402 RepID=UPI000521A5F4|nr:PREDICTED: uncharacterized protein C16orf59 homolog [Charadrius vociferus]
MDQRQRKQFAEAVSVLGCWAVGWPFRSPRAGPARRGGPPQDPIRGQDAAWAEAPKGWGCEEDEQPQPEPGSSEGQENRPSPKELEELELLNRALEKALKVRKSILKAPLEAQRAAGGKSAGEGPAPENAEEQPVPVEDVPESAKVLSKAALVMLRCQLKLPLPYRKAYSRNSSPAEIEEELKVLQDVPSLLSQRVEAEPADHPTLQREYESLLTLEGLQTTVSQCLHKLQLLRAGVLAVPLLCYSSLQELRDLFALKLRVSMLHQEIALQQITMAELLPVLESRLYPEASAAQLYRAIYTQLCEGGKRFPVLVRDELAD